MVIDGENMKCVQHGKSYVGSCVWCGKELCKLCVGKSSGIKLYCSACALKVKDMPEKQKVADEEDIEVHPFDPSEQPKRSTTFSWESSHKNGYFDFSSLVEKKKQAN